MKTNLKTIPMKEWGLGLDDFVIVSGPCSAESEEQVMATCTALATSKKVNILRAGIWKPRTRPNAFEGVGEEGLKWMSKAREKTGLPIACEVANAAHVELALKYKADILWIGARTTVNPFSIQEMADSLKGIDIPVMVKNPINPDMGLWIGAMERLNQAGITKMAAIHRGFSSLEKSPFRNIPKWSMAIELKRICPNLEVICDPSHIAGNRDIIPLLSQKAIDLDMNGLMIESHINPAVALSDAAQQLKPEDLIELVEHELVYRHAEVRDVELQDKLKGLRAEIDKIDDELIQILSTRMKIAEEIGNYKKENNVTILQVNRWDEIVERRKSMAKILGLSDRFIEKYLKAVHEESIHRQTQVMNSETSK